MSKSRGNIVRAGADPAGDGRGRAALFPAARDRVRAGRQLQLRRAGRPLQRRPRQRAGQPGQPHADDDQPVLRRRGSGVRGRRRHRRRSRSRRSRGHCALSRGSNSRRGWRRSGRCSRRWTSTSSSRPRGSWPRSRTSAAQLDAALYTAAEVLRIATVLLAPVLPESAAKIWAQLGMAEPLESVRLQRA